MNRWNNQNVTLRVQQQLSYAINSGSVGGIPYQTWAGNADGGFYPSVQFFAGGGVREDHRAQMVRAGAWRVFAEPETGGESYIPHAQSKRTTAVPVLRQTAGLMGYDLVPKGLTQPPAPQLDISGMQITGRLEIGGDGIGRLMDARIVAYDKTKTAADSRGYDGGL